MFLSDLGLGFTGLALGAMLFREGVARASSGPAGAAGTAAELAVEPTLGGSGGVAVDAAGASPRPAASENHCAASTGST